MDTKMLQEIQRLTSRYIDEDLTDEELSRLGELLSSDPEAVKVYLNLVTTHSDLTLLRSFDAPPSDLPTNPSSKNPTSGSSANVFNTDASATSQIPEVGKSTWAPFLRYGIFGFIASLLTVITYSSLIAPGGYFHSNDQLAEKSDMSVARIVRKVDCDWEGDRWAVVSSASLLPGQTVSISRGLMELEFTSMAKITLQAPASFTVESAMRGVLSHGKLTAEIPVSAHGFTVETPGGEAIDLGTKFGIFVGKDGTTETHVFEGEVVVRHGSEEKNLHLTDNMAIRMEEDQNSPFALKAVPERFTSLNYHENDKAPTPVVDRDLSLWFSADHQLQKDEEGRVVSWGDLCTESNLTSENAWQVDESKRPRWVANAIGGLPAVRFAKKTVLVTEPVKLGSAKTVVVVFKIDETMIKRFGIGDYGRQIFNFNGPPHLVMRINSDRQLTSQHYTGFRTNSNGEREYVNVGKTIFGTKLDSNPIVAVSVYDSRIRSARLYVNGILVDDANAPELEPTLSPRYIGAHMFLPGTHFFGDVSELMVYDTGLNNAEIAEISKSLQDKYQLPKTASD